METAQGDADFNRRLPMPAVTLSTKAYSNLQLKLVNEFLKSTLKGLNVETRILEVTPRGWVQLTVSGEDEDVAIRYLAEEVGLCPTSLEHVEKSSTIKGFVTALNKSRGELYVDLGASSPSIVDAAVSLQSLQAQLVDGRKIALRKVVELFGFCENLPLSVKVVNIDREKPHIEAALSEKQLAQFREWMRSLLDRLIVLDVSLDEVKHVLKTAGCSRDVVGIEPLGLFEHAVACKLGTDAAGLIPKVGKNLRNATFSIFNPRKILEFLKDYPVS